MKLTDPGANFGDHSSLKVKKNKFNAYLKFEVTGLGGSVQRVVIRLSVSTGSDDGGAVYSVSDDYAGTGTPWVESGLKANNAPALDGSPLSSPGAISDGQMVEFDVIPAITGNGAFSFAIKNNSLTEAKYRSRQNSTGQPELLIETQ